jgi:hypothetical protein
LRETVFGLGSSRNGLRRKAAGYVLDALWQQARDLLGPGWTTSREDFAEQIAERREFIAFMRGFWPVLRPIDVLGWLADPDRLRSYANGLLDRREMALLAGALPAANEKPAANERPGTAQNSHRAKPAGVSVEDVALLDELDDLLGQPPRPPRQQGDPYMVGGVREVTTYADRQAALRPADRLPRLRPHRRRRGTGRLADAVADDRAPGGVRLLDDRRGSGAVGLARRPDRDTQGA